MTIYTNIFLSWLSGFRTEVSSVKSVHQESVKDEGQQNMSPFLCSVSIHFFWFSTYLAPVWECIIVLSKKKLNYDFDDTEESNNSAGFKST